MLSELMNDDGTVMRGPQVAAFAEKHGLKRLSIADLIAYRQSRDKLVERVGEFTGRSEIGTLRGYAYVTPFDQRASHGFRPMARSATARQCLRACIAPT